MTTPDASRTGAARRPAIAAALWLIFGLLASLGGLVSVAGIRNGGGSTTDAIILAAWFTFVTVASFYLAVRLLRRPTRNALLASAWWGGFWLVFGVVTSVFGGVIPIVLAAMGGAAMVLSILEVREQVRQSRLPRPPRS